MNKNNLRYIAHRGNNTQISTNNGNCSVTAGAAKQHASRRGEDTYVAEYTLVPTGRIWSKEDGKWVESQITLE